MTHSGRSRLITRTLCMLLALALMPLGEALASEAMSASVTLSKEHMIERQQIAATLSIVGGTAPYTVSYDWIVYDFASTPDSRPSLHKADTIVTSDRNMSFGATIDAAGYGQLDVRITDANDKQIVISPYRDFVAYAAGDFPAEHAQQMLQGRWAYYGEDAAIDFTFILGPGGRARMNSNHYAQLGGYELVTGKAAVGGSGITLTTDLGDTLRFSYRLVATRQDPSLYMDLTVPGGESVFLEYDPNYAYSPFPNMTGVKPTPVPISEEHRRLMGSWSGVNNYDSSQTYILQLGEDGSLRFEYKSAVKPERNFSFEGKVTAVSSTVISYERDGYYSDYFQYELSADGQTLTLWYQDHEGSLRRGGTPAPVPGDASGDGRLDDKDLEAFVNMLVRGPLPALPHGADADQNSQINLDDLLWLIDRMV